MIPPTGLGDALDNLISQEGSKIIANVLLNEQYKDVRHTINNQEYVHLGIAVLGMTSPVSDGIIRNFETPVIQGIASNLRIMFLAPFLPGNYSAPC